MSDSNWDEQFHDSVESIVKMTPDQSVTFEMMDKDKKDQIKAIIGIQKELHELNKTLKQIAGRIK